MNHNRDVTTWLQKRLPIFLAGLLLTCGIFVRSMALWGNSLPWSREFFGDIERFAAAFGLIFLEAIPFMLIGALAAGVVANFSTPADVKALYSGRGMKGIAAGLVTGILFPAGEGGAALLGRALLRKGASLPAMTAMILAAPALNMLVLAIAMGLNSAGSVFWLRAGVGIGFAFLFALLLSVEDRPELLLQPEVSLTLADQDIKGMHEITPNKGGRWKAVGMTATREFIEFIPPLVAGALIASLLQIAIPQAWVPPVQGSLAAQIGGAGVWAILAAHSIGDLIVVQAAGLPWTPVEQIVFLCLGMLLDVRLIFFYLKIYRAKVILYLALLVVVVASLAGVILAIS